MSVTSSMHFPDPSALERLSIHTLGGLWVSSMLAAIGTRESDGLSHYFPTARPWLRTCAWQRC